MNKIFYALLKCFIIFLFVNNAVQAQSVDEPEIKHEIAPLYPEIERKFTKYNINGRSLRTREILDRLGRADSSAFYQYKNGRRNQKIGAGLVAGGGTFLVVGGMVGLIEVLGDVLAPKEENISPAVVVLMAGGGGLMVVGVIKSILGAEEKRKAIMTYNQIMNQKRKHMGFYMKPGLTGFSIGLRF
ncbi:hypothetical protein [Dyadobacter sp. LHD-138]|uniref:hypothetical protein n=1 Tax=Dyadobacter sp. LHD-138 TaxID=3071413 RepID=UPI0027E161CB|nr:hypothetical protein [Dyadobacter sp. LHD-138]MDQ6476797.1 hypothetical protein [Dyadobacter sp. LHD-138]